MRTCTQFGGWKSSRYWRTYLCVYVSAERWRFLTIVPSLLHLVLSKQKCPANINIAPVEKEKLWTIQSSFMESLPLVIIPVSPFLRSYMQYAQQFGGVSWKAIHYHNIVIPTGPIKRTSTKSWEKIISATKTNTNRRCTAGRVEWWSAPTTILPLLSPLKYWQDWAHMHT